MAKRFFYVAAGVFLLACAYQLGARRAEADWGNTGLVVAVGSDEPYVRNATATQWSRAVRAYRVTGRGS